MILAMWSGPRNLSSAMMYSFAQRKDFAVLDEPFYGPYLRLTGLEHPMRQDVLEARKQDAKAIEQSLIHHKSDGSAHVYHKHMCQHMIDGIPRSFMTQCVNVFLIRHPARVVTSFAKNYPGVVSDDIGFAMQSELFDEMRAAGNQPMVIDSADIRRDPEGMLRALCDALGLEWDVSMLSWPAGPKPYDGPWAPVWYKSLHASTGFAGPEGDLPKLTGRLGDLVDEAMAPYEDLQRIAIKA